MSYSQIKKKILRRLGNKLAAGMVNVLCKSLRIEEINDTSINELTSHSNVVFAFWHGKMLVPWFILRKLNPFALISKSKDGDLLVKVLEKWNYRVKRGSSSKDGKKVLNELIDEAISGSTIAITPDGPKGPKEEMKAGAVILAKKADIPLVLVAVSYNNCIKLKSWDGFEIPYFFSKVKVLYSDPIYIEPDLAYEETNKKIIEVENYLTDLQKSI